MKTHELAKALNVLAKFLRTMPDQNLSSLKSENLVSKQENKNAEVAVSLSTLASLSSLGKQQWLSVIEEYGLNIEVRHRDATRDILGKILRYLEINESERKRVAIEAKNSSNPHSEISSALSFLLNND